MKTRPFTFARVGAQDRSFPTRSHKVPRQVALNRVSLTLGLVFAGLTSHPAIAASDAWDGSTGGLWSLGDNWLGNPAVVPGALETATFNGAGNGNTVIDLGSGVAIGTVLFDTAAAAGYTVGSGAIGSQVLTLDDTGAVTVNATVANNQLFNSNLVLGTAVAATTTITNATTAATAKTLTFAGTVQGGIGGTAGAKLVNVNVATGSAVNFTNAITAGGASGVNLVNIGLGTVTLSGAVSSTLNTLRATDSGTVIVNGQNVTVASSSILGRSSTTSGKFILQAGSVAFNGGISSGNTGDGTLIRVDSGTFSASTLSIGRTGNTGNAAALPTSVTNSSGLVVTGGTAGVTGNVFIGTSNSSATALVSGGSLNLGGAVNIGNTTNSRWNILGVSSGTLTSTDTVSGIVLSLHTGTANQSELLLTGGTTTAERISFGAANSAAGSIGAVVLNGANASLYLGSGGIVRSSANAYTSTVNLTNGTLGAKADWSSSVDMNLSGAGMLIKAADSGDVAHDITLSGILSGSNGFTKTGGGKLILEGANSYTGATTVSAGTLLVNGALGTSAVTVNGGTLGGNGTLGGAVTVGVAGRVAPGASIGELELASLVLDGSLITEYDGTAGGAIDLLSIAGVFDITNGSVNFDQLGAGLDDGAYVFASYGSLTGTRFANVVDLPAGYEINYAYNNGVSSNHIALVAVPEPSAGLLAAIGLLPLARRKR